MQRRTALIVLGFMGAGVLGWTVTLAIAKVHAGAFNALDLAIYTQVAWLTAHGQLFGFTIHPHLYLGDHLELLFGLAAVPFRLIPSPLTLIALQCLAVIGAAFALFRFARRYGSIAFACSASIIFLLNPFTLNALNFEFHAVLFGLPFAFLAATAFVDRRLGQFWIWCGILVLAREDMALIVAGLAVVGLLERRALKWWLWPGLAATVWYVGADIVAGMINGEGYKFLHAFSGTSASGLIHGFAASAQLGNIIVAIALLLPVLGLPLFAWRWLPLLVLPFIGIGIAGVRSGDLILQTHYVTFFLPGLACTSVVGWKMLWEKPRTGLLGDRRLFLLILGAVTLYSTLAFGPTVSAVRTWSSVHRADRQKATVAEAITRATPNNQAILAGYRTLVPAAARPRVYASHYAFLGKRQYSDLPYPIPPDVSLVLLDAEDFITYQLQYANLDSRADAYRTGAARFRALLAERHLVLAETHDTLLVFRPNAQDRYPELVTHAKAAPLSGVAFALRASATRNADGTVHLAIDGQVGDPSLANVQVRLTWRADNGKTLEERLLPLGYGLEPTTSWQPDEVVTTRFDLYPPVGATSMVVEALVPKGYLTVDGWRSVATHVDVDAKIVATTASISLTE